MSGPKRFDSSETASSRLLMRSAFRPAIGSSPKRPSGASIQLTILDIEGLKKASAAFGTVTA